jgi:hypothetical protein
VIRASFVLAAFLLFAAPALARDVCVQFGEHIFAFKNPKLPKKLLEVTPLLGYMRLGSFAYPFDGSAIGAGDGIAGIGATVHTNLAGQHNVSFIFTVDQTFAGTGSIDTNGDGQADVGGTWTVISCDDPI